MALAGNHQKLQALQAFNLCVRCRKCCRKLGDISYSLNQIIHNCSDDVLLVRRKGQSSVWRPVGPLPKFPIPLKYVVCWFYTEERGCTEHGSRCSFARSREEASVWNVMKDEDLTIPQLVKEIKRKQRTLQPKPREKGGPSDCPLCQDRFPSHEDFMNHCFSVKHRRLIFEDTSLQWKYRNPPLTNKDLKLCERYLSDVLFRCFLHSKC